MTDALEPAIIALLDASLGTTCTAAVCLVSFGDGGSICVASGNTDPEANGEPVTIGTPFDLASLTKLFTGATGLRLVARGDLDLDAAVQHYLPSFAGDGKDAVRVRDLFTHTAGLPSGPTLFGPNAPQDSWPALLRVPLIDRPRARVVYSDTGFMVLGRLIETVTGLRLDRTIQSLVCEPLGIRATGFGPCRGAAATEWDTTAKRRIQGTVHDENAAAVGGIAGHAGLFGTAADVVLLAHAFAGAGGSFLPPNLLAAATGEQAVSGAERRGLAWKLRSLSVDAPEHVFSPQTFGHYGFTGTAVWHDPGRAVTVALLTNRVYFGRDPGGIHRLRSALFDLVARALRSGDGATYGCAGDGARFP